MPEGRLNILFFFLFALFAHPEYVLGQNDFTSQNLILRYLPESNIPVKYQVVEMDTAYAVLLRIAFPDNININETFNLIYEVKSSYSNKNSILSRTFNYHLHGIGKEKNTLYFRIEVPSTDDHAVFFIKIRNKISGITFIQDIPLKQSFLFPYPDYFLKYSSTGLPVCDAYIKLYDSLQIQSENQNRKRFFLYRYDHRFSPADPPMYRLDKDLSRSLSVDTVFIIGNNEPFVLDRQGLYFIQADTTSFTGIGIRSEEPFYPKMVRADDLIEPITYLATKQELNKLENRDDPRRAFELFWLNIASDEDRASRIIKKYFDQVQTANDLFTNYKQGWKTDMGMIYIIFGLPDEVINNGETESWYYRNIRSSQTIVFNFLRLKNIFTNDHYMLVRDNQYKNAWFKTVDEWRKGRK